MLQETVGWALGLGGLVALAAAFVFPQTRPYARKYWWMLLAVLVLAGALIFLRRKPGRDPIGDARREGDQQLEADLGAIDDLVDAIHEKRLEADAELARRLLESEMAKVEFDAKRATISSIEDSMERRKALIKLVEGRT